MSDLERAQEWLGCERYQDEPLMSNCWKHVPGQPKIADLTWPCSEATSLAALLAEVAAEGAADGIEGLMHELDCARDARLAALRADQWRAQARATGADQ